MAHRLRGLLHDPVLLHPLGQLARIVFFKLATGLKNHQVVEATLAITENQFVAASLTNFAAGGDHRGFNGPLADVAAVGAGVSVQCPAHRAGNADQRFQPRQPTVDAVVTRGQRGAAAGEDRMPFTRMAQNAGAERRTTMPGTPSSRTSRFEPWPSRWIFTPSDGIAAPSQSVAPPFRLAKYSAGPPN